VGPRGLPQEPEKTAAPEAAQIPMITRKVKADATLLGVGSASLSGEAQRQAMQAFVRLGDGSVRVVRPDLEKTQTNYLRVSRSADAAKVAAMPKERERTPEQRPEGERPGRGTPPPPPGAEPPGGAGGG
jgi:hypothetical protein